jgi:hypothetical protein
MSRNGLGRQSIHRISGYTNDRGKLDDRSPIGRWQDEWQSVHVNRLSAEEARHPLATRSKWLHEAVSYDGQEADAGDAPEPVSCGATSPSVNVTEIPDGPGVERRSA